MKKIAFLLKLTFLLGLSSFVQANEKSELSLLPKTAVESMAETETARIEVAALSAMLGQFSVNFHFGVGGKFSIGPSFGFHPLYLFNPENSILAYDIGFDSNVYLNGDRFTNSWFLNPYGYFSGYSGYRVEQPSLHVGFNFGYRWFTKKGVAISIGAGMQSVLTHLTVYNHSPNGRVPMGSIQNLIPYTPSFKFTLGFPI